MKRKQAEFSVSKTVENMPAQHSPWMMGSALHGWEKGESHGLDFGTSEIALLHPEETSDQLTHHSIYEPPSEV